MSGRNLFPNPRAHVNASDGWDTSALAGGTWERVTTAPIALPADCDAAFRFSVAGGGNHYVTSDRMPLPAGATTLWELANYLEVAPSGSGITHTLKFYDAGGSQVGSNVYSPTGNGGSEAWSFQVSAPITIPAGAVEFDLLLGLNSVGADWYLTELRYDVEKPTDQEGWAEVSATDFYRDGDSDEWEWVSTPHDSASRATNLLSPSILINGGATFVFERDVLLTLNPGSGGANEVALKNDGEEWGGWQPFEPQWPWTLAAGPLGTRKVWARFR